MIKAVIFDFFGVICSDDYWRYVQRDRQGDSLFRDYTDEVNSGEISWESFIGKVAKATNTSEATVSNMYETEKIDPRVAGLINELHNTYKTGLITNAHHEFIDGLLAKNHLRELFDVVVVSSRLGIVKPDPRIFEFALSELQLDASEVVYIDDLARHVDAASSIGIQAIIYQDFAQCKRELEQILNHT